jgi:hypothetical protein
VTRSRLSADTLVGRVESFDLLVGAGVVTDGSSTWPFHCTQLASGARTIARDTEVEFNVLPGLPGRWEAVSVRAVAGAFLCPVCSTSVVGAEGTYEICPACGWEDDPVQRDDLAAVGANHLSLRDARDKIFRSMIERDTGQHQPEARG